MTTWSADLHSGTKSRPLYRPLVPDEAARAHLVVCEFASLPADLIARFAPCDAVFLSGPDALPALARRLSTATTGLRLYGLGSEAFLWDVASLAAAAGMGEDEVMLQSHGPARRRVQCIHCKTLFEVAEQTVTPCPGCGLTLLVREHFSRRLGAFQGVATHGTTRGEASR